MLVFILVITIILGLICLAMIALPFVGIALVVGLIVRLIFKLTKKRKQVLDKKDFVTPSTIPHNTLESGSVHNVNVEQQAQQQVQPQEQDFSQTSSLLTNGMVDSYRV